MKRKLRGFAGELERSDIGLLAAVSGLLFLGFSVVYGAGSFNRQALHSPLGQHYIIIKHLIMIMVGMAAMIGLMNFDYHRWRNRWLNWGGLALAVGLVFLTLRSDRDINRWCTVMGFSFQPTELAKIAVIFFLAERLTAQRKTADIDFKHLLFILFCGPGLLCLGLVLQPNFGNIMVTALVTLVVILVAGVPLRRVAPLAGGLAALGVVAFIVNPKLAHRWDGFVHGLRMQEYSYQVKQSLIGLGAGGWRGLGIGQSHNKFAFLPESHTDFAFSVLGEEWGLFGTLLVIALLIVFAWRGFGIAARAADTFGRVLAAGLTTSIIAYGFANIAMVMGIFPVVGVPLPFVSFGGTAMITALASVGILLNIERKSRSYNVWKRRWDRSGV